VRPGDLTVFIVEDDASVRDSLALMLGLDGIRTALFADAEAMLEAWQPQWRGCVLADLRLPRMSGVELQQELARRGSTLPFIIVTAHGDVPSARAAFLAKAIDFLEKPFDEAQLRRAIATAFDREGERVQRADARRADAEKIALLTPREREVMAHSARGLHAKEIASALGISPRTVELHKARIMSKLGVRNIAELVRFALAADPPEDAR